MMQLHVLLLAILIGSVLGREIGPIDRKDEISSLMRSNDNDANTALDTEPRAQSASENMLGNLSPALKLPEALKPVIESLKGLELDLTSSPILRQGTFTPPPWIEEA